MASRHGVWHLVAGAATLSVVAGGLVSALGCRRGGSDEPSIQARQAEVQGRRVVREGTDAAICDATLLFARERFLGASASDPRWQRRGETYVSRFAPQCGQRIQAFWSGYPGCAVPLASRADAFPYWDRYREAAFAQYGLQDVAAVMAAGRTRWQQLCPDDFQAAMANEAALQAQVPLPVPLAAPATAEAPAAAAAEAPTAEQQRLYRAVSFMAHGQYAEALAELQAIQATAPSPIVTFNIAVCHDQLGHRDEAIAAYQQVAADPTFGPRAQARVRILSGDAAAPTADATTTARTEFERGLALAEAGEYQQAIAAFNRSYAAVPHPRTILNIAISYQRLGQVEAAISHYQLVVDDEALEPELRETAMQAIRELTGETPPAAGAE